MSPADHRPPSELEDELAPHELSSEEEDIEQRGAALLRDRRRLVGLLIAVVLLVVAIYVVLPKVVGLNNVVDRIGDATWYWVVVAAGFNVLSFAAYTMLFRGVLAGSDENDALHRRLDLRASYQITMAGFVATILFSAAGAGGVALTYWALRKAGMPRRRAACRMVAFVVLLYSVYALALILFGVLLRTGVLPGAHPIGATIVPAAAAAVLLGVTALIARIPSDAERRIHRLGRRGARWSRVAGSFARVPATLATGVRTAIDYVRHPRRSASGLFGALGWWAGNIGILWASFKAFGVQVPVGVVIQGYFLGMVANLAPSPAAGVGTVDAGLIGAFVVFGIPADTVFPAVAIFRLIGFWLPIPIGVYAYIQLRGTVQRWAHQDAPATIQSEVTGIAEAR